MAWVKFFFTQTQLSIIQHDVEYERRLSTSAGASETDQSANVSAGTAVLTHVWTNGTGEPLDANWPSGDWDYSVDVSSFDVAGDIGFKTINSVAGHMGRLQGTGHEETEEFDQTHVSVGIKVETKSLVWDSGATTNLAEMLLCCNNRNPHGNIRLTIRYSADSFINPPPAAAVPPLILRPKENILRRL